MSLSLSNREKVILGILAVLLLAGAAWKLARPTYGWEEVARTEPAAEQANGSDVMAAEIIVHVVGAVHNPGVYRLPDGSRVYEALALAGGVTPEADLERVNLARPLMDGEQVRIYASGEAVDPASAKININRATVEELTALPGIGEGRAKLIVEHREKYGNFTDITQIMEVRNIGQGIFEGIKDLITVY